VWFQGFDVAPHLVQQCIKSWKYYNPDWTIHLLDDTNLHEYITIADHIDLSKHELELWHKSDIIRMLLLQKHGGLWVDSTTFCKKPLNDWLPEHIKDGFFLFDSPVPEDRMIANWFIYSEKENKLLLTWCDAILQYFKMNKKAHTYFINHYLFGEIYTTDSVCKEMWDKVVKRKSKPSFYFNPYNMLSPLSKKHKAEIHSMDTPVYKLTNKDLVDYDKNIKGSNIDYLFSTIPI